jgi:cytochrome c-type biogenesis protein CcmE
VITQVAEIYAVEIFREEHKIVAEGSSETSVTIYQTESVITGKPENHNQILTSKNTPNFMKISVF